MRRTDGSGGFGAAAALRARGFLTVAAASAHTAGLPLGLR